MSDVWEGDDYPDTDGAEAPSIVERVKKKLGRRVYRFDVPKGNTKRHEAPQARQRVIAEATGKTPAEPEEWRQQLALGNHEGAASTLSSRKLTHNAGSGFGLAHRRRSP